MEQNCLGSDFLKDAFLLCKVSWRTCFQGARCRGARCGWLLPCSALDVSWLFSLRTENGILQRHPLSKDARVAHLDQTFLFCWGRLKVTIRRLGSCCPSTGELGPLLGLSIPQGSQAPPWAGSKPSGRHMLGC